MTIHVSKEERDAVAAYVEGTLSPLITMLLVKQLSMAAVFLREQIAKTNAAAPLLTHKAEDAPSDAAAVDVAGLMAMVRRYGDDNWMGNDDTNKLLSEIESALRMALAARDDDVFTALDMSPDTFRTEGGAVNVGKLRAAIRHPADYLPPDHWLAAAAPKGTT